MSSFRLLMDVLTEIYQSHQEMVSLAKHKKEVLIAGNIDELSKILQQEASWVKKIGKLEEERVLAVEGFLKEKGFALEQLSISDITKLLTSSVEKSQLQSLTAKLAETMEEIKQLNKLNTKLIKQSLDYISHSIDLIVDEPEDDFTYGKPTGRQIGKSSRGFFDQKA